MADGSNGANSSDVSMDVVRAPLMHNGNSVERLHREGVEQPDMAKWGVSKQDKAKLGEYYATGGPFSLCRHTL